MHKYPIFFNRMQLVWFFVKCVAIYITLYGRLNSVVANGWSAISSYLTQHGIPLNDPWIHNLIKLVNSEIPVENLLDSVAMHPTLRTAAIRIIKQLQNINQETTHQTSAPIKTSAPIQTQVTEITTTGTFLTIY